MQAAKIFLEENRGAFGPLCCYDATISVFCLPFVNIMIAETLASARISIEKSRRSSPLGAKHVTLIAASKQQGEATLREAIAAGIDHFGENRVQEAAEKWPPLRAEFPRLRLHMIGPLQTNKVREAVELFDAIHTIDRTKLADTLHAEMRKQKKTLECFIQVNTGEEPQKAGVAPKEADALIRYCKDELHLPLIGLMCVPPAEENPAPHFALLHRIARQHALPCLSMGMSDDVGMAVRLGATHVRIGRALFGERR